MRCSHRLPIRPPLKQPQTMRKSLSKRTSLSRRTALKSSGRIKTKKRKASETLRIYGPPARRAWMKTLPCSACGVVGYSEGAHVLGNGGMSRKADSDTQAPLCGPRGQLPAPDVVVPLFNASAGFYVGCHVLYDDYRWIFEKKFPDFDPEKAAADCQTAWLSQSGGQPKGVTEK